MLCILYVTVVGACLGAVGLLVERALPESWPRRWIWCVIIPVSMFIPGYYRYHHNWSVIAALEQQQPVVQSAEAQSFAVLDPGWWAHTSVYDSAINRIWLTTSAILVAWALANAWRVSRVVRLARRRNSRQPTIVDGVAIVVTDELGPATVGVLSARVVIPLWVLALPGSQRQYVLRHEEEHRRSHDALLLFVASLPLILMPWNLALWWNLRRLCLAVEMDCDKRVVGALGNAHAYGELLLKVAEAGSYGMRVQPAFLGAGMLERRLTQLLAPTPLRHVQRLAVPALALVLLALVVWMPHPIPGAGNHTHITTTTTGAIR
jgi:beta-lactamase regulating signal transducer with metallopeptidase domain